MVGGRAADVYQPHAVIFHNKRWSYLIFAISVALAAVFIYAGAAKVRDPLQFADSIGDFAILPATFITPLALSVPPFEIASGLLLLWSPTRRVGALAVIVISVVFLTALSSALFRGLTLDCSCFGTGAPSRLRMWRELGLDAVLAGMSMLIYLRSMTRRLV